MFFRTTAENLEEYISCSSQRLSRRATVFVGGGAYCREQANYCYFSFADNSVDFCAQRQVIKRITEEISGMRRIATQRVSAGKHNEELNHCAISRKANR